MLPGMPGGAGYYVAAAVARDVLASGGEVLVECVNPLPITRRLWEETASAQGCRFLAVELVCSDTTEHRRRARGRPPPGHRPAHCRRGGLGRHQRGHSQQLVLRAQAQGDVGPNAGVVATPVGRNTAHVKLVDGFGFRGTGLLAELGVVVVRRLVCG